MKRTNDHIFLPVRGLWKGLVGVPDKYLKEAISEHKALIIQAEGTEMYIPAEKVAGAVHSRGKEVFNDRFSDATYRLVYFRWKPNALQPSLI